MNFLCQLLDFLLFGELFLIKSPIGQFLYDIYINFCPTL